MDHVDKDGNSKIRKRCSLPLTATNCVSRIITDLCVFDVDRTSGALTLVELAEGVSQDEVASKTEAPFFVADVVGVM
jgi:3-oxoacid CoA-transferase